MKKIFISSLVMVSIFAYSQKFSDLKFETNVPDAENHYIVLPVKEGEKNFSFGFMYFDEAAGYTFRSLGTLYEDSGILKHRIDEEMKNGAMLVRVENLGFKSGMVSDEMLKAFKLPTQPEWLKNYLSSASENEKSLRRASLMNGASFPQLALPKLLKLYNNNYRTEALYFELVFSYNAMGKFAEAEKIAAEAIKNKKTDDLVKKEYIYALVHQEKLKEADDFLTKNLSTFTTENNKIEAMINTIASSAHHSNFTIAEKWLKELKSQPNINRYQKNINQLESIIKEKQSKIQ
ncbi:hypothetical protein [Chryseobacterium sp. 18068]|uniref:hypothetical protein n=1 Tax=Chryseobacterium sp. 18068 TaxID=2681414 RepID=UPI0013569DF8|nr:hypothetical protein [Chryseobacterium sp. 18068]